MAAIQKHTWSRTEPDERGRPRRVTLTAYGYDVRVNGKRERKWDAAWTTPALARAALAEREKAIAAGQATPPEQRTLKELADEYLRYKTQEGKRSVGHDRKILESETSGLLAAFGATLPVRALASTAIAQYEQRRIGQVSAFTVCNELGVLRHMLRLAKRWGYIDQVPEIEMPKKPAGRLRYLDEAEIARLLDACAKSRNPYLTTIVTLAINTGMRKGEILGLEWERVDVATARITLYQTKSGKPRGVPMNRAVYDALTALEPDAAKRQGFLFRKRDDRRWGQIRRAFETAAAKAGLKDFRFHDLRHTAASHLVMRGASLADVKEILGHADLKMTLRYAHLGPAHLRGAVDRLDGLTPAATPETRAEATPVGHLNGHTVLKSGASAR
jgi:integrase